MSTTVRWRVFDDADVDTFKVQRAIAGITVAFPNSLVAGDVLAFAATSQIVQRITFPAVDIDSVIATFNAAAKGAVASKNAAGTKLFIRCTATQNPRFKLVACTFATHTSQTPRIIVPALEFVEIASVAFVVDQADYTYEDLDGDSRDTYRLLTVKGAFTSVPSIEQQPADVPPDVCVVEGRITDLRNNPLQGATIRAKIMIPPGEVENTGLSVGELTTITDSLGRWSMLFTRNQQIFFDIEAIGYTQVVQIPDLPAVLFKDLEAIKDHYFSTFEDPQ